MPFAFDLTPEREAATILMRRMKAQEGGAEKIAQALSLQTKTVKGWNDVPACHVARFDACFGKRPPSRKIVPSPHAAAAQRIKRKCLCCGARFVADGRFLRLCKPCRGRV